MPPADTVTPGIWGFVSFAALAIVLYFLMRNMNARMRRMSYRQRDAGREADQAQALEGEATASQTEPKKPEGHTPPSD